MQDNVSGVHAKGVKMGRYFRLITYNNLKGTKFSQIANFSIWVMVQENGGFNFCKETSNFTYPPPPQKNSQLLMVS